MRAVTFVQQTPITPSFPLAKFCYCGLPSKIIINIKTLNVMATTYTRSKADHEESRNEKWPEYRDAYLKTNGKCAVCGATKDLQVHHIYPVSYIYAVGREDLELNFKNYMTLCETEHGSVGENHHLLIGHLDNFKSRNSNVKGDTARFKAAAHTEAAIKADSKWKAEKATRPKPAENMTQSEKDDLKKELEDVFGAKPQISNLSGM